MEGCFKESGSWYFYYAGFKLGPYDTFERADSDRQEILAQNWKGCKTGNCED